MTLPAQSREDSFLDLAFDIQEVPDAIERDQWGRPLLLPSDTLAGRALARTHADHKKAPLVPYTRASTLSDKIANKAGLHKWDVRQVVRGLALREDLCAMACGLPALTGDKKADLHSNHGLDEYADLARVAAAADAKANWGTAVHALTDPGRHLAIVPKRMQADVGSYWDAMAAKRIEQVASEVFVANDELGAAGTFDGVYSVPGYGLVVGDKKTGIRNMHTVAIQMAVYSNADHYAPDGARVGLEDLAAGEVSKDVGLYIHIPRAEAATRFYLVNLRDGFAMAKKAAAVRDWEIRRDILWSIDNELDRIVEALQSSIMEAIHDATTPEELQGLWELHKPMWSADLTSLAKVRLDALTLTV